MKEAIKKIENQINYIKKIYDYIEKEKDTAYKIFGYDYKHTMPFFNNYELEKKIKDYEYLKDVFTELEKENIDITKKYFITDNIYLLVFLWGDMLTFHFYIDNDSWFYENYISSHSGINEWIQKLICEEYDLFSGNSSYNYAFGTMTLEGYKYVIDNEREEFKDRKYKAEEVVKAIKSLINYFTDENNKTRNVIIAEINHKIANMKKLIEENED